MGNGGNMLPARGQADRPRNKRVTRPPRWAELWQIPLFCLGLGVCAAVLFLHTAQAQPGDFVTTQYQAAIDALDKHQLEAAGQYYQAIHSSTRSGQIRPVELQYLQAGIMLAEAQKQFALPVHAAPAYESYSRARVIFEGIIQSQEKINLPRLYYRLALATLGSETLNKKNLDTLEQTLESNFDDRHEGYLLLARLRTQLTPPDDVGSLRCLDSLMSMTQPEHQYPHRLLKAESLFRLERWGEIPRAVSSIPETAKEYPLALQWQALAAFRQNQWGEAALWWAKVAPRDMTPQALLNYGICQRNLKNPSEAQRLWDRLSRDYLMTPEALQAQCSVAELAFDQGRWHDAVVALASVLTTYKPAQLANAAITSDEMQEKLKTVGERLIQAHRWEDLQKLGEAAEPWHFTGLTDNWLCQAWHGIADSAAAGINASIPAGNAYAQASNYAWKAAQHAPAADKQPLLLLAGQDALKARKYQQAQRSLGELLTLNPEPGIKAQVLIGLAESLQEQKLYLLAAGRLREALDIKGNHEATARLRLAWLLMLDVQQRPEAGKQLEMAAALAVRPESGPDARTACHRRALFLYNSVMEQKTNQVLEAIDACETALKRAVPHPEAAQTHFMLAELLLTESGVSSSTVQAQVDVNLLSKQASQLWHACHQFQVALEEFRRPEAVFSPTQDKATLEGFARFGQAQCWYALGDLKEFAPQAVPSRDVCWQHATELFASIATTSTNRVESLHAYYRLSLCHQKRGLFAEMQETLRDARQQLKEMKDSELATSTHFVPLKRSEWEYLLRDPEADRGQP
jgi:tetratricopeptide (TPR) repeat protein